MDNFWDPISKDKKNYLKLIFLSKYLDNLFHEQCYILKRRINIHLNLSLLK